MVENYWVLYDNKKKKYICWIGDRHKEYNTGNLSHAIIYEDFSKANEEKLRFHINDMNTIIVKHITIEEVI